MNRTAPRFYMIILGAISTAIAFFGTLATDGIRSAVLTAIFVALQLAVTGTVGLRMFWKDEERGK